MSTLDNSDVLSAEDAPPDAGALPNLFSPATNVGTEQEIQNHVVSKQAVQEGDGTHHNSAEVKCNDAAPAPPTQRTASTLVQQSTATPFRDHPLRLSISSLKVDSSALYHGPRKNRSRPYLATRPYPQTVSGATGKGSHCISELCLIVYSRVGSLKSRDKIWLSDMIRRFAVRFGLESSDGTNQDVFHFVHKCHLSVSTIHLNILG